MYITINIYLIVWWFQKSLLSLYQRKNKKIMTIKQNLDDPMFSGDHFVLTQRGLVKAKNLTINHKLISLNGDLLTINKIFRCGKRPNAPIIDISPSLK